MKLIRYAIRKKDLHSLLQTIGVLQKSERLLAVNNLDLTDPNHDVVIVTVTTEATVNSGTDPSSWSAVQLQNRLTELSVLEDAATRQLRMIVEELYKLREFISIREASEAESGSEVPDSVERNIRDQIRRLLSGEEI